MFKQGDRVADLYNVVNWRAIDDDDLWTVDRVQDSEEGPWLEVSRYDATYDVTERFFLWGDETVSADVARQIVADDETWARYAAPIAQWSAVVARAYAAYLASK